MRQSKILMRTALCVAGLCSLVGCGNGASHHGTDPSSEVLESAAWTMYIRHVGEHNAGPTSASESIPESSWPGEIQALHPVRVYLHRANVAVVQKASDGVEEGKYICLLISSYAPRSGDDGFTFMNQDGSVYDFKRVKTR
jgi:hypothetical protein